MSDAPKKPGGVTGLGWKPGQSGNPGGRAKGYAGIAAMIRKETSNGKELVDYSLAVLRDPRADWHSRDAARNWLGEYAFGKAPQTVTLQNDSGDEDLDWSNLNDADIVAYIELRRKMGASTEVETSVSQ